jgi:hypothetical protein
MREGTQEAVTVGELLARIRSTYVESFARRLAEAGSTGQGRLLPEVAVCHTDGALALTGSLGLPQRVDACTFDQGQSASVVHFGSERMLGFEPLTLVWGERLRVELSPFTWDACELCFALPEHGDLGELSAWYRRWFDEGDERAQTNEFPGCVVHSLAGPEMQGDACVVVIDLGSARLKAFQELLDAVAQMGRRRVSVGNPEST